MSEAARAALEPLGGHVDVAVFLALFPGPAGIKIPQVLGVQPFAVLVPGAFGLGTGDGAAPEEVFGKIHGSASDFVLDGCVVADHDVGQCKGDHKGQDDCGNGEDEVPGIVGVDEDDDGGQAGGAKDNALDAQHAAEDAADGAAQDGGVKGFLQAEVDAVEGGLSGAQNGADAGGEGQRAEVFVFGLGHDGQGCGALGQCWPPGSRRPACHSRRPGWRPAPEGW